MSLLTDDEIADAYTTAMAQALRPQDATAVTKVARAIEAAVIKRLATVSVEPVVTVDATMSEIIPARTRLYTETALAAARVQAIEEAAKIALENGDGTTWEAIRALIGGAT